MLQNVDSHIVLFEMKELIKFIFKKIHIYKPTVKILIFLEEYKLHTFLDNVKVSLFQKRIIIPSFKLRHLVSGNYSIRWFLDSGEKAFSSIENILNQSDKKLEEIDSVLDFGCGCGRVIQYLHTYENIQLNGCDYNSLLINWCRKNIKFASFSCNQLCPPLEYEDHSLGMIYAFSVFTHLTVEQQDQWLREFYRVLKPNGLLILSTHGPCYQDRIPKELLSKYESGEIVVQKSNQAGENDCAAYHPANAYQKESKWFKQLVYLEKGAFGNPDQDLYLLEKK